MKEKTHVNVHDMFEWLSSLSMTVSINIELGTYKVVHTLYCRYCTRI